MIITSFKKCFKDINKWTQEDIVKVTAVNKNVSFVNYAQIKQRMVSIILKKLV